MTLEELTAEVARLSGELTAVNSNKDKLVKEKRDALTRAEAAEAAIETANSATLSDLDKANKRAVDAEKALTAEKERADKLETTRRNERADTLILKALNGANVDAKHTPILSKALRGDVQFNDDGEPLIDGKSVDDFAKTYFGNKGEGHGYVRAPDNGGGAATGHDGTKAPRMTKENFNFTEFAKIQLENPAEANAIADAVGRPNLKTSV
ncbi:hypothetical protein C8J42_102528 [Sphingomonas sp. PP-CE-1A-559]|uniref:hypothetical protein n=1 Tax=Sphingomonas sp. PP-CE-1A-559 TaxID=2135657 RepID=UPI001056D93A|nr:hypothetical protein [Sphingomonas sp. PP-CE-1A-559]TCP92752.1 hypothetical protein C8J42_102528 [Sphingomonas sp. PP-CE-1A-559]